MNRYDLPETQKHYEAAQAVLYKYLTTEPQPEQHERLYKLALSVANALMPGRTLGELYRSTLHAREREGMLADVGYPNDLRDDLLAVGAALRHAEELLLAELAGRKPARLKPAPALTSS